MLMATACTCTLTLQAQEAPQPEQSPAPSAMATAAQQVQFLTEAQPDPNAAFYMYVNSAYWCGPCRRFIPEIIAAYDEMRKDNHVEVILLSHDHSVKGALRYIELFSIPFPAVMYESEDRTKLPGAPNDVTALPHIVIVDAQGNVVHSGHASTVKDWKTYTNKTN